MKLLLKLIPGLAVKATAGLAAPVTNGIPNLHLVAPGLWRGGQFGAEGAAWLKSQGITRRLKLNSEREGSDDAARQLGFEIRSSPISLCQQLGFCAIDPADLAEAIAFIAAGPCFVGCQHGQDRTGLIIAMYRVVVQGWSCADAEAEMLRLGFHKMLHGLWEAWLAFKRSRP